jgi:hypothetical protein
MNPKSVTGTSSCTGWRKFGFVLLTTMILCLGWVGCTSEEPPRTFTHYPLPTTDDLYRLSVQDNGDITAIGGYVWSRGIVVNADARLTAITVDSFCNKGQFDLLKTRRGDHICVGTDGYLFSRAAGKKEWTFHRLANWDILQHVMETPHGFIASGGKSYEKGYIFLIDSTYTIDTAMYFGHEISEVISLGTEKLLSLGWGTMQLSTDMGRSWQPLPVSGDFFASGHFSDAKKGLVIGFNGTLYATMDGGMNWKKRTLPGAGFDSFRKLRNIGNQEFWITGTRGRVWQSKDGGNSWSAYQLDTGSDVYDVVPMQNGQYLVCGSNGFLAAVGW